MLAISSTGLGWLLANKVYHLADSSVPNWSTPKYCGPQAAGTDWIRSSGKGKSYTYAAGVKLKSVIGINLKTSHAWSHAIDIDYHVAGSGHAICGKDAAPTTASKFRMRNTMP